MTYFCSISEVGATVMNVEFSIKLPTDEELRSLKQCPVNGSTDVDVVVCTKALIFNQNATTKLVTVPTSAPYSK